MASDKFELVIEVDSKRANAAIMSTNDQFRSAEKSALQWATRMSGGVTNAQRAISSGMQQSSRDIQRAKESAEMLGMQLGIHLPEGARKFIAETKLLGTALNTLFKFSVYLAAGEALFTWVHRIGEKVGWWGNQTSETTRKNDELTRSIRDQQKELDNYYNSLEEIQRARAAIGAPGGGNLEIDRARSELAKAQQEFSALAAQENRLTFQVMNGGTEIVGGVRRPTSEAEKAAQELAKVDDQRKTLSERVAAAEQRVEVAKLLLKKAEEESAYRRKEEVERTKQYVSADAVRAGAAMRAAKAQVDALATMPSGNLSPEALAVVKAFQTGPDPAGEQHAAEWLARRANEAAGIVAQNESMIIAQLRRSGQYQEALDIELRQLERLKGEYAGNAEAIAALEEQKKLKIADSNRQIADSAKSEFERSAQTIEGFFNRVFMSARSATDVLRQLWGQLANYAVSQMAKMAAAALGGYRQSAVAASAGVGGGSMAAIMPSIFGGGGGGAGGYNGVGTPPFVGSGSGMGSMLGNFSTANIGTSFANFAMSPAGALAGVGIFAAGAKRGGALGLGMSVGGGFLAGAGIGSMIAGPYGAGIGAAIGLGVGLTSGIIGLFRKSPEEKLKEKIRQAYGVTIRDRGVLQQILSIAQSFGGNLDMTIRNREVRDLISLYAQTTNQTMRGAPMQMSAATMVQSGGSLSMAGSYTNGSPSFGSLPGASLGGVRSSGIQVAVTMGPISVTVPDAKDMLTTGVMKAVADNPRVVSNATVTSAQTNYNRRQLTALQLKPGLVTA